MSVARVARVDQVEAHPDPAVKTMSVLRIGDLQGVSQNVGVNLDQPRYAVGDLVVIMTKGAVLPEDVLKMNYWDPERIAKDGKTKGAGMLVKDADGRKGCRVADRKSHGFNSQFITFPVNQGKVLGSATVIYNDAHSADRSTEGEPSEAKPLVGNVVERADQQMLVREGDDVMAFFGVTEFKA